MSLIYDALNQIADIMRTVSGVTVHIEREPGMKDPVAPTVILDADALAVDIDDTGMRARMSVGSRWVVRAAMGSAALQAQLDLIEALILALEPEAAEISGPVCSLNVSAAAGGLRDSGSNYTEGALTVGFFIYLER